MNEAMKTLRTNIQFSGTNVKDGDVYKHRSRRGEERDGPFIWPDLWPSWIKRSFW